MDIHFNRANPKEAARMAPFYAMRPNKTCDSGVLDTFLWSEYYDVQTAIVDEKAVLVRMKNGDEFFSAMPYCSEEDLPYYFDLLRQYFNEVLKKPLKIYLADEEGVKLLKLEEDPHFLVKEESDLRDYIYDGEELRTLPGKKFHKKKNLVNKFCREYEGRWEYRTLHAEDKLVIWAFLDQWYAKRAGDEENAEESLEYEVKGIHQVLQSEFSLPDYHIGGIFIDGQLEAFSMGALNSRENMACISVEKGNADIHGIYQVINQQFLIHEFPEATLVNREDDLGLEGLRRAKESYNPCGYARKYMLLQTDFTGWQAEITDQYEAEIDRYEDTSSEG